MVTYAYWHDCAIPVHQGMAVPCAEVRVLIPFFSSFVGIPFLFFRALFVRLFRGFLEILLERVFCNQIVGFKVVQELSFDFNSSLFPKSLFLLLLLLGFYVIHVSSFYS